MENRILARLDGRADPEWLLTLLSVLPLNTYTLEEWNEALSQAAGRRIFCPSYRTLSDYLHRLVLGAGSLPRGQRRILRCPPRRTSA